MTKRWIRVIIRLALVSGVLAAAACGNTQQNITIHPLREAYTLLDKGQTAKAIMILEHEVSQNPSNSEGRVLLSSAYLGEAGVDVYKIHDTFKDILFAKPLNNSFWHNQETGISKDPSTGIPAFDRLNNSKDSTPAELFLDRLDYFLVRLRQVVTFLNRFPDVEKVRWGLLDKALEYLDSIEPTRDICLYRVFIRIIYLRAFLRQEIVLNPDLGTRKWLCNLDIGKLRDQLTWVAKNLADTTEDFRKVYPNQAHSLAGVQDAVSSFLEALDASATNAPAGTNTSLMNLQHRVRETIKCEKNGEG